jgi:protoporphyrinogen/coproporphyrinogen III oxidase
VTPRGRSDRRTVAVIGGGVAGLTAAFLLKDAGVAVTVLEGSPRLGGKLLVSEVGGVAVDAGAEALLARRPEGVGVIGELGLTGELEIPGTTAAGIWTRGQIRALPRRQFMGVPADFDELAATGILSADGLARARQDLSLPDSASDGDVSVTSRVGGRFGPEVVDRLVEPLLGGVYAGRCEDLSFEATLPALAQAARGRRSLTQAAASLIPPSQAVADEPASGQPATDQAASGQAASGQAAPARPVTGRAVTGRAATGRPAPGQPVPGLHARGPSAPPPVFTTLSGGLGMLPAALAQASGADIRTGAMVRELVRTASGWRLTIGSAHEPQQLDADAVIIAVPGRPASRLLADVSAPAAAALAEIRYASMAIITLAYPDMAFDVPLTRSGFLVPAVDDRAVKAVTFSTVKWPHLRSDPAGLHIVRCSVGRLGDEAVLQRDDAELASLAAADLAAATGVRGVPVDVRVTRWGGGLPQYSVGHLDRVARIRAGVAAEPGLAVCGAAYDGVGIPACISTARLAVDQVLAYLGSRDMSV